MFTDLGGIPDTLPVGKETQKLVKRMSIPELDSYISAHDARAVKNKNKGLKSLVALCKRNMVSEDDTVETVLNVIREKNPALLLD